MEASSSAFTPVRRHEDTFTTRRIPTDDGKAWTTARCNRLLRPLISRVSALGRLPPSENLATEKPSSLHRTRADNLQDDDSMREDDNGEEDDAEWAPVRKKLKRTYSSRSAKGTSRGRPPKANKEKSNQGYSDIRHRMPFLVPGEISVPTPILNRTTKGAADQDIELGRYGSLDENLEGKRHKRPKSRYLTTDGDAHFELSEILRKLRRKIDPSRYTLYEGIYNGLESLLKATMADFEPAMQDRSGVRSLFKICLRQVPAVIKDEEEFYASEEGKRSAAKAKDVSSEIYAELEALGHGDRGWKHLRTVVRAHGVQIVGDAITEGLVRPDFARALVLLCVHTACLDEAEMLISCLLEVIFCPEPKSIHSRACDESTMIPLAVLEKFASYTGRRSFQARQLTGLFVVGKLPVTWLATKEFGRVWTYVIQSSTSDVDSATFLTTLIPMLCASGTKAVNFASADSVMLKALDATLASVLTALSAITVLDTSEDDGIPQSSSGGVHQPGAVLRQCLISCTMLPSPLNDHRTSLLAFSNVFITPQPGTQDPFNDSDLFLKLSKSLSIKQIHKSNDSIASFICSVACCCGRGASNTGFNHLKLLHRRLSKYLENHVCSNKHVIREAMIDSAFSFARRNDDCEHLDYAEDIESELHGKQIANLPRRSATEATANVSVGFRWEEGISEWVTATPAFSFRKAVIFLDNPVENEIDGDSPLRRDVRHGKRLAVPPISTRTGISSPVTKHFNLSKDKDHTGAVGRAKPQHNQDLSSDSEDDPLDLASIASTASNNSSFTSSQSTEAGDGIIKKSAGRRLRPRFNGLRSKANPQFLDHSDDELSSSTTSWDTSIKLNRISVIVLQDATAKTSQISPSHRYATRRKTDVTSSIIPQKRVADDDDSADELC